MRGRRRGGAGGRWDGGRTWQLVGVLLLLASWLMLLASWLLMGQAWAVDSPGADQVIVLDSGRADSDRGTVLQTVDETKLLQTDVIYPVLPAEQVLIER